MTKKDNFTLDNPIMFDKKNGRCRCIPIPYEKDMTKKRFSIKKESSIGLSSIYTDNGKVMTQLEVLDVLIKQHETIQTLIKENEQLQKENQHFRKVFGNKYDAYINGEIGGNVNEM